MTKQAGEGPLSKSLISMLVTEAVMRRHATLCCRG